jgi:hypothetical protein
VEVDGIPGAAIAVASGTESGDVAMRKTTGMGGPAIIVAAFLRKNV